jgi:hypothetical protein
MGTAVGRLAGEDSREAQAAAVDLVELASASVIWLLSTSAFLNSALTCDHDSALKPLGLIPPVQIFHCENLFTD